jgi:hypothetical protein
MSEISEYQDKRNLEMESLPSSWKLDDTRRNMESLAMNGTLPNFKNLLAERQGNCDKRKKNPRSYLSKLPK